MHGYARKETVDRRRLTRSSLFRVPPSLPWLNALVSRAVVAVRSAEILIGLRSKSVVFGEKSRNVRRIVCADGRSRAGRCGKLDPVSSITELTLRLAKCKTRVAAGRRLRPGEGRSAQADGGTSWRQCCADARMLGCPDRRVAQPSRCPRFRNVGDFFALATPRCQRRTPRPPAPLAPRTPRHFRTVVCIGWKERRPLPATLDFK